MTRHQPKELNLNPELVKTKRQQRKQQRKQTKELSLATRKNRKLELSKNNLFTEYKNTTQSLSVLLPTHLDTHIKESHYQVSTDTKNSEDNIVVNVTMPIPTLQYLDQFWNWLHINKLPLGIITLYPNMKEISESVAAYVKMKSFIPKIHTLLVIGDGSKPRTAALFACLHPQLNVHSIDPMIKDAYTTHTNNLHTHTCTIQQFLIEHKQIITTLSGGLGIVCVHCHADFDDYMPTMFSLLPTHIFTAIYTLKCCGIYQSFTSQQLQDYKLQLIEENLDFNVHTPHRKYAIWQSSY